MGKDETPPNLKQRGPKVRDASYLLGYLPPCIYSHCSNNMPLRMENGKMGTFDCQRCSETGYNHALRVTPTGKITQNNCEAADFGSKRDIREGIVRALQNGVAGWMKAPLRDVLHELDPNIYAYI